MAGVPLYEFKCKECDDTFEVRRPMSEASDPAVCPQGHDGAVRLLSVFASVGASSGGAKSIRVPAAVVMRRSSACRLSAAISSPGPSASDTQRPTSAIAAKPRCDQSIALSA